MTFLAITYQGPGWADHAEGFDLVSFPVMPDAEGKVYQFYGADAYYVFLVDRTGRLVTRFVEVYDDVQFPAIRSKLRDLHAE